MESNATVFLLAAICGVLVVGCIILFFSVYKIISYSKRLLIVSWIATIVLTIAVVIGEFLSYEMSGATTLASLAWGELTAIHGFYLWKSRAENRSKYAMQLVKDVAQEYGIDAAVSLASTVLQE